MLPPTQQCRGTLMQHLGTCDTVLHRWPALNTVMPAQSVGLSACLSVFCLGFLQVPTPQQAPLAPLPLLLQLLALLKPALALPHLPLGVRGPHLQPHLAQHLAQPRHLAHLPALPVSQGLLPHHMCSQGICPGHWQCWSSTWGKSCS